VARTDTDLNEAFKVLSESNVLGCDTETSSLSGKTGRILSVQFSDGETSVLIPTSEGVGLGGFIGLLEDSKVLKVFHNARFDLEFLCAYSFSVRNVFCTMTAEKVLTRGANQSVSLAETLYRYFAIDLDKSKRNRFSRNWDGVWTEDLIEYALSDVVFLPRLMNEQSRWMDELSLREDYENLMKSITGI